MFSAFDLFRLAAAFATVFLALPYLAFKRRGGVESPAEVLALGFVHAAFFVQVSAMVLGDWKLYLPGAAAATYAIWLGAAALFAGRRGPVVSLRPAGRAEVVRLLEWIDKRQPVFEPAGKRLRQAWKSPVVASIAVIAAVAGLRGAWFALHHVRLQRLESYTRAISLHSLMRGETWNHDPSVALLAPLAWLSGLAPDQIIRLSGSLVCAALVLAVAFTGWRRLGNVQAALTAPALFAGLLMAFDLIQSEPSGAELSAVFVILAVGLAGPDWGAAALSLVTAALLHLGLSPVLLLAAVALTSASVLASLLRRAPSAAPLVPALAALAVLLAAIAIPPRGSVPEHQYEAAARVAHRIAGEFRTNDWIVVSPGLEVAQTYGRGWHLELADFVNAHSETQMANPAFRLPYSAQHLFVFVEKRVLDQPAFSFAHDGGAAPYYYSTRLGRASLEFRAARLMASYVGAHRDSSVYYEDDDLIVYRIARSAEGTAKL